MLIVAGAEVIASIFACGMSWAGIDGAVLRKRADFADQDAIGSSRSKADFDQDAQRRLLATLAELSLGLPAKKRAGLFGTGSSVLLGRDNSLQTSRPCPGLSCSAKSYVVMK